MTLPVRGETRLYAASTLVLLVVLFSTPTHMLGNTAVFGRAYLWGESSSRCNQGRVVVWFVDRWEVVQHALFGAAFLGATAALAWGTGRRTLAVVLAAIVLLDLRRSVEVDGSSWWEVTQPAFWCAVGWVSILGAAALRRTT